FCNMKELIEYFILHLKNLEIENPLSVYILADELYKILIDWPEEELHGITGLHHLKDLHCVDTCDNKKTLSIMTAEQLYEYYRQYKKNPQSFMATHGIFFYPTLHKIGEKIFAFDTENLPYFSNRNTENRNNYHDRSNEINSIVPKSDKILPHKLRPILKTHVYSMDPHTKTRTRLSEIHEITISTISSEFLRKFKRWEYLEKMIYLQLSNLMPFIQDEREILSLEGEIDMDLLVEVLSNKNHFYSPEFLDVHYETNRSFEVIIGLDASGSTANRITDNYTILDVEKAFAIILGKALCLLSPNVSIFAFNSNYSTTVYRCAHIHAVSSLTPAEGNRDGDFIRYIKQLLVKSREEMKYFFFISDGCPDSVNYKIPYALDDTLIAMRETTNAGIRLIYFNIELTRKEYFELFKNEATFARHFIKPDELLYAIPEIVEQLVRS
ncbi:MAG: hypothetical protein N2316_01320, partial [Spirochaetes bacterium]|nr:hypothetical protein [Spirochaetota bacterium]